MQFPEGLENTPLNLLFTVIGGKFFQVQDIFLEYFFWEIGRLEKRISLSEKRHL